MTFTVPISFEDINTLPDNTDLIENLYAKEEITTVVPRFLGDISTGRFVTAFFVFRDTELTVFVRRRDEGKESKFERQNTVTLANSPTKTGNLWNQTIFIEGPDVIAVEKLKQRVQYDTIWLSTGGDPEISFEEYYSEPFNYEPKDELPDCPHHDLSDFIQVPNLGFYIRLCNDCKSPIALDIDGEPYLAFQTLTSEFLGLPESSDEVSVRGTTTEPTGPITAGEIALHVLTRIAHAELSHFEIYARAGRYGYIITLNESVAGYALWNEFDDHIALQQIYVLPHFRHSSFGKVLVDAWHDELGNPNYYAIGLNNAGAATLEGAGHLGAEGPAQDATILSCRDTTNPADVNASYADAIARGEDPLQ